MSYIHQAQYYETDQMGIIHHSNYIRWMEEARIAYMKELGFDFKDIEESGIVCPVLQVCCDYKAMTYFADRVIIDVKLHFFRGVKYAFSYRMTDEKTGELRAEGSSSHCFLGKDGRPVNIKKASPALYEAMQAALCAPDANS